MNDYELYGLRIPITLEMFADVREQCSRLQELGTCNVFAIIDLSLRDFFLDEEWTIAGLRGLDSEVGKTFLLVRRLLNRSGDGVLPVSTETV